MCIFLVSKAFTLTESSCSLIFHWLNHYLSILTIIIYNFFLNTFYFFCPKLFILIAFDFPHYDPFCKIVVDDFDDLLALEKNLCRFIFLISKFYFSNIFKKGCEGHSDHQGHPLVLILYYYYLYYY